MTNLDRCCCRGIRCFSAAVLFLSLMLQLPAAALARPQSYYVLVRG